MGENKGNDAAVKSASVAKGTASLPCVQCYNCRKPEYFQTNFSGPRRNYNSMESSCENSESSKADAKAALLNAMDQVVSPKTLSKLGDDVKG